MNLSESFKSNLYLEILGLDFKKYKRKLIRIKHTK